MNGSAAHCLCPVSAGIHSARHVLALETIALRQQLAVFKRTRPRPKLRTIDRIFWITVRQLWSGWADAPREELFNAIRIVRAGGSLLQPVVASRLLSRLNQDHAPDPNALTPRETEVLNLLAQGLPNKEIAAQLVITERTVKFHVSSIMSKLGAGNRTEVVAIATQRGLLKRQ